MWVHKFITKETRTQVPKFKTFLRNNQDLLKLWYEVQPGHRRIPLERELEGIPQVQCPM